MIKLFSKYTLVGAIGTLSHYALLIMLVELGGVNISIAVLSGVTLGAIVNYTLNYYAVFKSQKDHRQALPKFLVIAAIGMVTSLLVVKFFVSFNHNLYLFGQVVATGIYLILGFIINKHYTF